MTYSKLESEDLVPGIATAFSAQTVLSTYQLKNYVHYDLSLTDGNDYLRGLIQLEDSLAYWLLHFKNMYHVFHSF